MPTDHTGDLRVPSRGLNMVGHVEACLRSFRSD